METLQFDLNELVSKQIGARIAELEKENEDLITKNNDLYNTAASYQEQLENSKLPLTFLNNIRQAFATVEADPKEKNDYHQHKNQKQFDFVANIMLNVFGVAKEQNGWLSSRGDGNLYTYLAVNYYESKQQLLSLLELLSDEPRHKTGISFIKSFKMPMDWSKEEIISFLKAPGSCTNGSYMGISEWWVERGAGRNNCPYDLVLKSPLIVRDDVWEVLVGQIKAGGSESHYFLSVYNWHKLSVEKIQELGDVLVDRITKYNRLASYDTVKTFFSANLLHLSKKTLNYLYENMTSDNQFKTLHWENFPIAYQYKYLMGKNIEDVLKTVGYYACKWTVEQKDEFLKEYYKTK